MVVLVATPVLSIAPAARADPERSTYGPVSPTTHDACATESSMIGEGASTGSTITDLLADPSVAWAARWCLPPDASAAFLVIRDASDLPVEGRYTVRHGHVVERGSFCGSSGQELLPLPDAPVELRIEIPVVSMDCTTPEGLPSVATFGEVALMVFHQSPGF